MIKSRLNFYHRVLSIPVLIFIITFINTACHSNNENNSGKNTKDNSNEDSSGKNTMVEVWLTTGDTSKKLLQQQPNINFKTVTENSSLLIEVNGPKYQQIEGFGAALTDSAAWLIYHQLSADKRNELMNKLFSPDDGIGINYLRLPLGGSDFVNGVAYTYDDISCGETDWQLNQFSIQHDKEYIIPILKEAMIKNPQLKIIASPWTAPAWMKENCSLYDGQLKNEPGYTEVYSDYLVKFIQAYQEEGISISAITLQNEPLYESQNLPTMGMDWWDQVNLLVYNLVDKLNNIKANTKILVYDHNWENYDYALNVLNDLETNHSQYYQAVSGTAFHCYQGSPERQSDIYNIHPKKDIYFTECSGWYFSGQDADNNFASDLVWQSQNLIIGAIRNWAKTVIWWNLALDQDGGPHLASACGENEGKRCRGMVTINTENNQVSYHVEYYVIGHASKFLKSEAYRIDSTTFPGIIETVAFQNPDNSKVLIVLNSSEESLAFGVKWKGQYFDYNLDKHSIVTFKWP
ncbi:MAG: glycosyl hydrolase [Thioploca sp.]|nr:glycosyl hydrolase [Thioploca sp.]